MVTLAVILRYESVSIGNLHSLEELGDDQAVMAVRMELSDEVLVVDKEGRWKYACLRDMDISPDSDLMEAFDAVLRDETISYRKDKSGIGKRMLTKAVNVPDFKLRISPFDAAVPIVVSYYVISIEGNQRRAILIGRDWVTKDIKWDVNLLAMRFKMKGLVKRGEYYGS